MKIPAYEACKYVEVIKILEMKQGYIYHSESTNKYIIESEIKNLPKGYIPASVRLKLLRQELNVVPVSQFT